MGPTGGQAAEKVSGSPRRQVSRGKDWLSQDSQAGTQLERREWAQGPGGGAAGRELSSGRGALARRSPGGTRERRAEEHGLGAGL